MINYKYIKYIKIFPKKDILIFIERLYNKYNNILNLSDIIFKKYARKNSIIDYLTSIENKNIIDDEFIKFVDEYDFSILLTDKYDINENFIDDFNYKFDFSYFFLDKIFIFSENFLRKYKDKVNWTVISKVYKLDFIFIEEMKDYVDWEMISIYQYLSDTFIEENINNLNLLHLIMFQELNRNLIEVFINKFNNNSEILNLIFEFQHLDEILLRKYYSLINWNIISEFQNLSENFILEHIEHINFDSLYNRIIKYNIKYSMKVLIILINKFHNYILNNNYGCRDLFNMLNKFHSEGHKNFIDGIIKERVNKYINFIILYFFNDYKYKDTILNNIYISCIKCNNYFYIDKYDSNNCSNCDFIKKRLNKEDNKVCLICLTEIDINEIGTFNWTECCKKIYHYNCFNQNSNICC